MNFYLALESFAMLYDESSIELWSAFENHKVASFQWLFFLSDEGCRFMISTRLWNDKVFLSSSLWFGKESFHIIICFMALHLTMPVLFPNWIGGRRSFKRILFNMKICGSPRNENVGKFK